ncbi:MAG: hypothetical protein AAGA92_12430 [Planctomycetota bacterium]
MLVVLLACAQTAQAQNGLDRVRRLSSLESGEVTRVSALEVTLARNGVDKRIPSYEIRSIAFADEPRELSDARQLLQAGRYEQAVEKLNPLSRKSLGRRELDQEVAFGIASARGRLALAGQADAAEGRAAVGAFVSKHKNSYHLPAAIELLGDLELAAGNLDGARSQYEKLTKPGVAYYALRAALLLGRLDQAAGDHPAAVTQFQKVLSDTVSAGEELTLAATLGSAVSRSATGDVAEAAVDVRRIIAAADNEDTALLARAWNALGDCYREARDTKSSHLAYLHVDVLYPQQSDQHARALYHLVGLWNELGRAGRSQDAAARLQEDYPESRWAAKL